MRQVIGILKNELGGQIMKNFSALRAKMYPYRKLEKSQKMSTAKVQRNVQLPKALDLMTIKPPCLIVKRYAKSKRLRI